MDDHPIRELRKRIEERVYQLADDAGGDVTGADNTAKDLLDLVNQLADACFYDGIDYEKAGKQYREDRWIANQMRRKT